MLVLDVDEATAGHMAMALELWRRHLRDAGVREPDAVAQVRELCSRRARTVQQGSKFAAAPPVVDAAGVALVLLTLRQVASRLGISYSTVRRLVAAGALPVVRIGRSVRVDPDELDAFAGRRSFRDHIESKAAGGDAS